ncbi:MAG: tetratricopeptide repeat protein [Planctomycetota bacterium]|jgi:tetratricopeptide (TPR) repeat protein|nr:tetratricopeptide repeat protein [Planctomycetota bacterium]
MIGRFGLDAPPIDDSLSQMVESHRSKTGQDYAAILFFGLWGTVDCSTEVRLYAAYRHLLANPEDGPAWLETSRTHLEAGDADKALSIVDELLRLDSPGLYPAVYLEDPEAHRAHILADSGRLDEALEEFDGIRRRHDDSPALYYAIGSILHEKEDFPAAAGAYAEALEALERFRLEALEEESGEDIPFDFAAVRAFIEDAERRAENRLPFAGARPIDLSALREE